jgi:putative colanic acid biosynthesis glycosyltransferase
MTTNPLFCIITITRNNLAGLCRTRASLMTQDCSDYEWIIIDGASTDGTSEFLKTYSAIIVSEPDLGIYDAMNKGLDRAKGTYVLFMNAGDNFASSATLSRIRSEMNGKQPDFIYGDALEMLEDGGLAYKKARSYTRARQGMITHHQAMLYKQDLIGDLRFNLQYKISADFDFTLKFLNKAQTLMPYNFPLCVFENGGLSQTNILRGRCEQFRARAANDITVWENVVIFLAQSVLWSVRWIAPALYWRMKARG